LAREWVAPPVFLNQERWNDEPSPPGGKASPGKNPYAAPAYKPRPAAVVRWDGATRTPAQWYDHCMDYGNRGEWDRSVLGPAPLEPGCKVDRKILIQSGLIRPTHGTATVPLVEPAGIPASHATEPHGDALTVTLCHQDAVTAPPAVGGGVAGPGGGGPAANSCAGALH
jgi:hypothetical protein